MAAAGRRCARGWTRRSRPRRNTPGAGCTRQLPHRRHPVRQPCAPHHLRHQTACCARASGARSEPARSKDMRDNWAIGWSEAYTVGVLGSAIRRRCDVGCQRTSGAAPIWGRADEVLHAELPSRAPNPPRGVLRQPVRFRPRYGWPAAGGGTKRKNGLSPARSSAFALPEPARIPPGCAAHRQPGPRHHSGAGPGYPAATPASAAAHACGARASGGLTASRSARASRPAWLPWPGRH